MWASKVKLESIAKLFQETKNTESPWTLREDVFHKLTSKISIACPWVKDNHKGELIFYKYRLNKNQSLGKSLVITFLIRTITNTQQTLHPNINKNYSLQFKRTYIKLGKSRSA